MMKSLILSRVTLTWIVLLGATLLSWEMGHGMGFESIEHASMAIILVSFVKVRFVMHEFMELRHAPLFMRLLADGWIVVVTLLLLGLYLRVGG
ncbi:cytochrome C oxidase subunit IV family protein [Sphingobium sp. 15-1]|uniref:cytochrome C oxidase subunit IV family protein n=1 Tax=Sphingobium sp. 15-1 TaxID=2729616 RepID=UPI00159C8DE1|nr:cytochrome C oxidase subunit IV family protein [Sphingobium sp. 15-1]